MVTSGYATVQNCYEAKIDLLFGVHWLSRLCTYCAAYSLSDEGVNLIRSGFFWISTKNDCAKSMCFTLMTDLVNLCFRFPVMDSLEAAPDEEAMTSERRNSRWQVFI